MSKKQDMVNEMVEYTDSTISIECQSDNCNKVEQDWQTDDYDFCNSVYKKGWRIINDAVLCPSCVRKSKSQQKKRKP